MAFHVDVAVFARTQADNHLALSRVLRQQPGKRTCGTDQLAAAVGMQADVVDDRAHRQHVQGQTVATLHDSQVQQGLVDLAVVVLLHLAQKVGRKPWSEGLHNIAGTQARRRQNVRQVARFVVLEKRNVARPVGVVLDPHNRLPAAREPVQIHQPHSSLVATASTSDRDVACVVTPCRLLLGHGQLAQGRSLVEMVVDGLLEVRQTRLEVAVGIRLHLDLCHG